MQPEVGGGTVGSVGNRERQLQALLRRLAGYVVGFRKVGYPVAVRQYELAGVSVCWKALGRNSINDGPQREIRLIKITLVDCLHNSMSPEREDSPKQGRRWQKGQGETTTWLRVVLEQLRGVGEGWVNNSDIAATLFALLYRFFPRP